MLARLRAIEMVCFWTEEIFSWCCWGNRQSNALFVHVQQSTSLGSFRGSAEEDPDEGLNASRVAPAVFPLEAFNALGFELKGVFSLFAKRYDWSQEVHPFSRQFYRSTGRVVSD
jgi:hypothetical protein